MRGRVVGVLAVSAVLVGLLAEFAAHDPVDVRRWLPDLVVGWTFVACGITAARLRPRSRTGALLVATGFTWFLGNFSGVDQPLLAAVAGQALHLHRGVLVHCLLAFPGGRLGSTTERVAVAVGYGAALVAVPVVDVLTGIGVVGVAAHRYATAAGPARRSRAVALRAAVAVAAVLAVGAVARPLLGQQVAVDVLLLLLYQLVLVAVVVGLLAGLLADARHPVTDVVVELTGPRAATVRDTLARALGDPTVEVAYWLPATGGYVDAAGRPFPLPDPGSGRATTPITVDDRPVGVLVHDPAVLDDPGLVDAVTTATRLAGANARLQAEVRARVDEVAASRRRLVAAADTERRLLQEQLRSGAGRRLAAVGDALERAAGHPVGDDTAGRLRQAGDQLHRTEADVREFARGLHPPALAESGLAGALAELVAAHPGPVALAVVGNPLPPDVAATAYFVCAEALANVAKHAVATTVEIAVEIAGPGIVVTVADDGGGGADAAGSGLRGLADRVEALGGRLAVHSPADGGTRLVAEIPLGEEPRDAVRRSG